MTTHGGRGSMVWGGGHAQVTTWLPNVQSVMQLGPTPQWMKQHTPGHAARAYTSVDEAAHTRSCS